MKNHQESTEAKTLSRSFAELPTDFLPTYPSSISFESRLKSLGLSSRLEEKLLTANVTAYHKSNISKSYRLSIEDEKELATETLITRHAFSNKLLATVEFRQAALTIIQNIYLFKNRKIFFASGTWQEIASERKKALELFSDPATRSLRLDQTLQHLIVARIWRRILNRANLDTSCKHFVELHTIVSRLNALRNCYMITAKGLVLMRARKLVSLYQKELPYEDAVQVGLMGIGRAAYRYHPSQGIRFATFASNYINRELQQQALNGRLIRLSSNVIEQCSKTRKNGNHDNMSQYSRWIQASSIVLESQDRLNNTAKQSGFLGQSKTEQCYQLERRETVRILTEVIDKTLSPRSADLLRRRFGLSPYENMEQSIIAISKEYRVTRSALYQMEKNALNKLRKTLEQEGQLLL